MLRPAGSAMFDVRCLKSDVWLQMFSMFEAPKVRCLNEFRRPQSKPRTEKEIGVFLTVTSSKIKAMNRASGTSGYKLKRPERQRSLSSSFPGLFPCRLECGRGGGKLWEQVWFLVPVPLFSQKANVFLRLQCQKLESWRTQNCAPRYILCPDLKAILVGRYKEEEERSLDKSRGRVGGEGQVPRQRPYELTVLSISIPIAGNVCWLFQWHIFLVSKNESLRVFREHQLLIMIC